MSLIITGVWGGATASWVPIRGGLSDVMACGGGHRGTSAGHATGSA